jgi:hypothetical protein
MKIVFLGADPKMLTNFRFELIKEFCALGHEVFCCAAGEANDVADTLAKVGAKYIAVDFNRDGINPVSELGKFIGLSLKINSLKPDVVLTVSAKGVIYGSLAAFVAGVPYRFSILISKIIHKSRI